jgi:serine/threonine-protein kinase
VIAALVAIIGSRIVYRLSAQAGKAEELGSYRLVAPLGHGGMGEVWRAEHRMLARDAAIKLVRGREGGIPRDLVARFEREAKATAGLRSPHTVQLYDFGRSDDGAFYYVMELLDGYTLDRLVERHGALPPGRVVSVLRQACRSLAEAHGAGLVHRDIKPGNIFLCRYGGEADFVKVVDFGLVKDVSSGGGPNLTQTGLIAGTPAYMPPEMALGKEVDGRSDLYALGCVGYYLLTGKTVFDRKTALETLHDHTSTPPVPPSQRVATPIPADLEAVLLDCLAKEPADRPESARVLEARLAQTSPAGRWSAADAERWWDLNAPAAGGARSLPTEPNGTRLDTPEARVAAGR